MSYDYDYNRIAEDADDLYDFYIDSVEDSYEDTEDGYDQSEHEYDNYYFNLTEGIEIVDDE
jgi:hypothetical protein